MREMKENRQERAKVLAIAVQRQGQSDEEMENSLDELFELLKTLGADMVGRIVQKREDASRIEYLGTGKLEEAKELAEKLQAEYVVADDELSAMQMRNIEKAIGLRVKDRTSVILDIFAAHASTREGKIQVDLAMLQYQYPRLLKMWTHLERQRGGIGLKGPGETQLETDRRIISVKIKKLEEELEKVAKAREQQGKKRVDRFAPLFSLVGYTNAGKSTLLNAIAGSNVQMCNGLFTTLDPTARRIDLKDGYWCIVSDTVGFIRKLPHLLVNAFKATLESVVQSEVLLIVCDISDPQFRERLEAVEKVLHEIGAANHEKIYVFNKIDKGQVVSDELLDSAYPNNIKISAANKTNLDILMTKISEIMKRNRKQVKIVLPIGNQFMGDIMSIGKVYSQEWGQGIVTIKAELPNTYLNMLKNMPKITIEEIEV